MVKTKRALLASALAIVACVAMLVGSTFAWFTDTASTGVNKIQAGNLKLEVLYRTSFEGDWQTLKDATDLFGGETTLFEPGHTRVVELKIKNAGNLALKYKIGMNVAAETAGVNMAGNPYKLSDYLKVATSPIQQYDPNAGPHDVSYLMEQLIFEKGNILAWKHRDFADFELEYTSNGGVHALQPGDASILGIKVYMPTAIGNEANAISSEKAASISFGLNVVATQYTTERDSYGTQYDKDATYPTLINTSDDLIAALKRGSTVIVDKDMTIDGDGDPYREVQLKDVGKIALALNVTLTSGDLSGYNWGCMRVMPGTELTVSADANGKFVNTSVKSIINVCGGDVVINGGVYESAGYGFFVYTDDDAANAAGMSLTINSGTFKAAQGVVNVVPGMNATVIINGGTFYGWDPTPYVDADHAVQTAEDGGQTVYTVVAR